VLVARVAGAARSSPGQNVRFHAALDALHLFDARTGEALAAPRSPALGNGVVGTGGA
jgi:hypothetical protein